MPTQRLQLKLKQQLSLAPQLQQAIRLLQMNRIELQEHIQQALDSNPLLEQQDLSDNPLDAQSEERPGDETGDIGSPAEAEPDSYDDQWGEMPEWSGSGGPATDRNLALEQLTPADGNSLHEHLLWQVNLTRLSDTDTEIAKAIIYALDEDGYLLDDIEDIRSSLAPDLLVDPDEVQAVLHRIQRMEPVGAATRDPGECILVQLDAAAMDTPGRDLARKIVRHYLDQLAHAEFGQIARELAVSEESLQEAIELIQSMEPRPGARYDNRKDEYVVPDVYVCKTETGWQVSLSPENEPRIQLNNYYMGLMKTTRGADASYLKGRLQEARWLLSSLEMRNRTLVTVTTSIVERQSAFLEHGEKLMQPLILKEIAVDTGLHESTISRATTRKYALTPRGMLELKYFFSSHVRTLDGRAISATAVKAHLYELIDAESGEKTLSDQSLADLLAQRGIRVARRTVAKYRESLGIPSSTDRRRRMKMLHKAHAQ